MPLLAVLLAACAVGPYASTPRYKLPETRATAARQLNEALAFGSPGISEVAADDLKLTWHEMRALTDKRSVLLKRELDFNAIRKVNVPDKPGELWQLVVDATGGQVTFTFNDGPTASKAEVALRRLMQPLTEDEQKALAERYYRVLHGQVQAHAGNNGERAAKDIDWAAVADAIGQLKLTTGEDFGEDAGGVEKWLEYLARHYDFNQP